MSDTRELPVNSAVRLSVRLIGVPRPDPAQPEPPPAAVRLERTGDWLMCLAPIVAGGLAVALAYAGGREHRHGAIALYWLGQAVMLGPSIYWILSPRTSVRSRVAILVGMAATQALLAWAYSPDQFRFPDELQHVRSTLDIVRSHHLFKPNPELAVSPGFPGLELATDALMSLTGLSLFAAGTLIASISHTLVPLFLFLSYRELSGRARTASIAALLYATAPHYGYFDTLFIYSAPALLFLAVTLYVGARAARGRIAVGWVAVPYVPVLLSHHLTTFVVLALLAALALFARIGGERALARRMALVVLGLALVTVAWIAIVSPSTFGYLAAPLKQAITGALGAGHTKAGGETVTLNVAPAWESQAAMLAAGVMALAMLLGLAITLWANTSRLQRLFALLGLVYPVILMVRLFAPDGSELATRALTYGMLVVAYPTAVTLECLWFGALRRAAAMLPWAVAAMLFLGALVTGLPAAWQRLPGRFIPTAFESGVDARVAALGRWARNWPAHQRAACDFSVCSVFGANSDATMAANASPLYYATSTTRLNQLIARLTLDYVQTDLRWTGTVPPTGEYFFTDVLAGRHAHPLARSIVSKFAQDPLLDRVYDDGDEAVYDTSMVR